MVFVHGWSPFEWATLDTNHTENNHKSMSRHLRDMPNKSKGKQRKMNLRWHDVCERPTNNNTLSPTNM